ncbi:MAG TPA: PD-(D/E)XK nuclease family protein, partial [Burkholderiales bacterium]|nr:PD-(D/E)XK nuclease family protein [Burkholderiales bacterium]
WSQAQGLIAAPALTRYFDPNQYRSAANEIAYVDERGETRRIDRLVEFDKEVCVLDYKSGSADAALAAQYAGQLAEYRAAAERLYPGKKVRGLLVFSDGTTSEG